MVDKKFENLKEELEELRDEHKTIEKQSRKLEEKVLELYTLYNISKTLSMSHQLDDLFNGTMTMVGEALNIGEWCLMLLQGDELFIRVAHGLGEDVISKVRFRLDEGVSGKVARSGKAVLIQDVTKEKGFLYYKGFKKDIGSFLSVPLIVKGEVIGILNTHKPQKNAFRKSDLELFTAVAEHVSVAIEKARLFEKTKEDAARDELTKLYNRRFFFEKLGQELKRAKRYKRGFSIIIMDIDHFKNYNDLYGHIQGDNALRQTARIMEEALRGEDIVARFGGEEFIMLLPEVDKKHAVMAAEKLRKRIADAKYIGEDLLPGGQFTASFGVSSYREDGEEGLQLIDMADKALYLSKNKGRNRVFSSDDLPK